MNQKIDLVITISHTQADCRTTETIRESVSTKDRFEEIRELVCLPPTKEKKVQRFRMKTKWGQIEFLDRYSIPSYEEALALQ